MMIKMSNSLKGLLALLILGLLTLGGCDKPVETELPIETVFKIPDVPVPADLGGIKKRASREDLDLQVAMDQTQARQITETLSMTRGSEYFQEIVQEGEKVDYEEYLIIVADWGAKPSTGWEITIEKVIQVGRDVHVFVRLVEPTVGGALVTYPIHTIKIRKADLTTRGPLSFFLMEGKRLILTYEHTIP